MKDWHYKRDTAGKPRRFLSHRELLWWAVTRVGMYAGGAVAGSFVLIAYEYFSSDDGYYTFFITLNVAGLMIVLWMGVSATIYLYITLSGGVMSREERTRTGRDNS